MSFDTAARVMNAATLTPPADSSAPSNRPVCSRWFPASLAATDADLQERFLGADLSEVCCAATAAGDPLFIATAGLPLKNRREAVANWRAKQLAALLAKSETFANWYAQSAPEVQAAIRAGETPFAEIDLAVASHSEEASRLRMETVNASKARLREAVKAALRDCDGSEVNTVVPGFIAIREDGEVGLFRRRGACVEWARASGGRYLLAEVARESLAIHPGGSAG